MVLLLVRAGVRPQPPRCTHRSGMGTAGPGGRRPVRGMMTRSVTLAHQPATPGIPAINVPCGFTDAGLPVGGFELYGRPLGEPMILRITRDERAHPWHTHRPPVATLTRPTRWRLPSAYITAITGYFSCERSAS